MKKQGGMVKVMLATITPHYTQRVSLLLDVHICISVAELDVIVCSSNINRKIMRKQFFIYNFPELEDEMVRPKRQLSLLLYQTRGELPYGPFVYMVSVLLVGVPKYGC